MSPSTGKSAELADFAVWSIRASGSQHAEELKFNQGLNVLLGFLFAANGIVFLLLSPPVTSHTFVFGFNEQSEMISRGHWDIKLNVFAGIVVMIKSSLHFLYGSVFCLSLCNMLERGYNLFRWVEYSLTYAMFLTYEGYVAGLRDVTALFAVGGLGFAAVMMCLSIETNRNYHLLLPLAAVYVLVVFLLLLPFCFDPEGTWITGVYLAGLLLLQAGHGLFLYKSFSLPAPSATRLDIGHSILSFVNTVLLLWLPHTVY